MKSRLKVAITEQLKSSKKKKKGFTEEAGLQKIKGQQVYPKRQNN
jgi:hypothetical protein